MPDEKRDTVTDAAPDPVIAEATAAIEQQQLWVARDLLAASSSNSSRP